MSRILRKPLTLAVMVCACAALAFGALMACGEVASAVTSKPGKLRISGRVGLTENWQDHAEATQLCPDADGNEVRTVVDTWDVQDKWSGTLNVDVRFTGSRTRNLSKSGVDGTYSYTHVSTPCGGGSQTSRSTGSYHGNRTGGQAVELHGTRRGGQFFIHFKGDGSGTDDCAGDVKPAPSNSDFTDTFSYTGNKSKKLHFLEHWDSLGDSTCDWGPGPSGRDRVLETISLSYKTG